MHVRVDPHSPAWAARFEAEAARVADALDGALIEIHHIGSTAVPGLDAKPVIDMMPVVRDPASADARRESLEALGYEWCGEFSPMAALPSTGLPLPAPMSEFSEPMGPPVGTTLIALNKAPAHSPCQELLTGACALTGRHVGNL